LHRNIQKSAALNAITKGLCLHAALVFSLKPSSNRSIIYIFFNSRPVKKSLL